ncbi:MAG: prepilin-type cleavage/methylation domain-containing protein [Burkholderiales bacterium PBB5]|nr:MAG: prepilin-type cleavage/methylation domain-containing protein [Burkholderiales bacterium PBB5]
MCADARHPVRRRPRARQGGFTLPEALLAIVVIGVGLAGVMLAFSTVVRHGADPVLRKQMTAIAQELLEEIQLKPYTAAANSAASGCARDTFNDVLDYNGYASSGFCTVDGVAISALSTFNVSTTVASATLNGVAAALKITVTVQHAGESLQLVGWRTDYASP